MNSRKGEICIVDVHRASYVKHLRSKKLLEIKNKMKRLYQNGYFKNLSKLNFKKYIFLKQ